MFEVANAVMCVTLEQSPNDSSIRLSLSRRLVSMKRYEESEALLRAGTQLSNRRAAQDSWAGLADHFVALDDLPAAAAAYEKSYALIESNVYTFEVHPGAAKPEIRSAIEEIFNVKVASVNTLNRKGKTTRNRRTGKVGSRPDRKRAIVTLADGDSIDIFKD